MIGLTKDEMGLIVAAVAIMTMTYRHSTDKEEVELYEKLYKLGEKLYNAYFEGGFDMISYGITIGEMNV